MVLMTLKEESFLVKKGETFKFNPINYLEV